MRQIACLGDALTCAECPFPPGGPYTFPGIIAAVSSIRVYVGGRPPAVLGDIGICGGPTTLICSTVSVFVEGRPVHLIGDTNSCAGTTIGSGITRAFVGR